MDTSTLPDRPMTDLDTPEVMDAVKSLLSLCDSGESSGSGYTYLYQHSPPRLPHHNQQQPLNAQHNFIAQPADSNPTYTTLPLLELPTQSQSVQDTNGVQESLPSWPKPQTLPSSPFTSFRSSHATTNSEPKIPSFEQLFSSSGGAGAGGRSNTAKSKPAMPCPNPSCQEIFTSYAAVIRHCMDFCYATVHMTDARGNYGICPIHVPLPPTTAADSTTPSTTTTMIQCGKKFTGNNWKVNLVTHFKTHDKNREKEYTCGDCGKQYRNEKSLANHAKEHAGGIFPCTTCGIGFPTKVRRDRHVAVQHREQKRSKRGAGGGKDSAKVKEEADDLMELEDEGVDYSKVLTGEYPQVYSAPGSRGERRSSLRGGGGGVGYAEGVGLQYSGHQPPPPPQYSGNFQENMHSEGQQHQWSHHHSQFDHQDGQNLQHEHLRHEKQNESVIAAPIIASSSNPTTQK